MPNGSEQVTVTQEAAIRFLRHEDTIDDRKALKDALVALDASSQSPVPDEQATVTDEMVETLAKRLYEESNVLVVTFGVWPAPKSNLAENFRAASRDHLEAALNSTTHNPEEGDDDRTR